jgi:hypothetical protein
LRRVEIKNYNGLYRNRGVLARIRRKIEGAILQGECVLLDGEGVVGLTAEDLAVLIRDLPAEKLRVAGFPFIWSHQGSGAICQTQKPSVGGEEPAQ